MLLHLAIIMLMMSALAAFLILWYFWVKRRLAGSYFLDDEQQVLFPFRYFSWVLLGVVFVTCVAQVHFVRVSSRFYETLATQAATRDDRRACDSQFDELTELVRTVRGDLNSGFRRMTALSESFNGRQGTASGESCDTSPLFGTGKVRPSFPLASARHLEKPVAFGKAARASSAPPPVARPAGRTMARKEEKEKHPTKVWSMNLNLMGQVTADVLRVRERPEATAPIVERLAAGSVVRVTQKRFVEDSLWFKIVPRSKQTGWVDFRYVKLLTSAKPAEH